jgi:Golgi nucleoside diphosphatase
MSTTPRSVEAMRDPERQERLNLSLKQRAPLVPGAAIKSVNEYGSTMGDAHFTNNGFSNLPFIVCNITQILLLSMITFSIASWLPAGH